MQRDINFGYAAGVEEPAPIGRRERRKLELRARILETAAELFAERGFAETKVAEVCERADIAHKTFFNHFPSKQDLLREIARFGVQALLEDIEASRKAERTTAARLAHFFTTVAERVSERGPMNRELMNAMVAVINEDDDKATRARALHEGFAAIVHDGLDAGELTRRHDAETLTEMIVGAFYVLMFNYANLDSFDIRTQADALASFLADALAKTPTED